MFGAQKDGQPPAFITVRANYVHRRFDVFAPSLAGGFQKVVELLEHSGLCSGLDYDKCTVKGKTAGDTHPFSLFEQGQASRLAEKRKFTCRDHLKMQMVGGGSAAGRTVVKNQILR